jgi:hypothetical protein
MTNEAEQLKDASEKLALEFHDLYEALAPTYGYETRKETRRFDPYTPNGRLMIAVCRALLEKRGHPRVPSQDSDRTL